MAKGNMLLGQAVGSVGDITFSRINGKQVIKAKPSTVKNPQTEGQLIQRILMNTVIQAYSKMSEICDHSFEGVSAGQDSMSYFMQRNLKLIRYQLSVTGDLTTVPPYVCPLGVNGLASNDYVVAKGSLPEIVPQVSSGGVALALTANTYQAVLDATGAKRGDQLTFITVSGTELTGQKFTFSRIILDPVDQTGEEMPLSTPFINAGAINCPNSRNENNGHTYSWDNTDFLVSIAADVVNLGCVIASRQKTDGSWLRSNASLILEEGYGVGDSVQEALDQFAAGGIDVENPRYLNNARRAMARRNATDGSTCVFYTDNAGQQGTAKTIVSVRQGNNIVILTDDAGVEYCLQCTDADTVNYGKYYSHMNATSNHDWGKVEKEAGDPEGTVRLDNYKEAGGSGIPQVEWLVSKGCNVLGFYVN